MKFAVNVCPLFICAFLLSSLAQAQEVKYPSQMSDTPNTFVESTYGFDHIKTKVMIPMRDGVKLNTVIIGLRLPKERRFCSLARPIVPIP